MPAALEALTALSVPHWGTVVHLGAGDGRSLDRYARLPADRLVLVEGDAEASARLAARASGLSRVEVVSHAAAANTAVAHWYRYNLPEFNGLSDRTTALRPRYPRVQIIETLSVITCGVAQLLEQLRVRRDDGRVNGLAVDLPDQGESLFDEIDIELLACFDWISWTTDLPAVPKPASPARQHLEATAYTAFPVRGTHDADATTLLQRDPLKQELWVAREQLHGRLAEFELHQRALNEQVNAAEAKLSLMTDLLVAERRA